MTRFEYYTANADRLVQLLHEHYRDEIMFCSPDRQRDFDGYCTEASLTDCEKCLEKWLEGEMEGTK